MDAAHEVPSEQMKLWNGVKGHAWVEAQAAIDQMFGPLEALFLEGLTVEQLSRVLDIGCGTGSTTLALARAIGARGHCVGIDLSAPMIAAARSRAGRAGVAAHFIRADAESYPFEPAGFDVIVSRLGVMFFDDPVRAFANLRRAARDNAALRCVVWRAAEENPFMTTAERAAAPLLPQVPARRADAPGQFAFAEASRIRHILRDSGWTGIDIRPVDVICSLPKTALVHTFTRLGPLGEILHEVDERTRSQVIETVCAAFDPYVQGADLRYTAACWMVAARCPAGSITAKGTGDA